MLCKNLQNIFKLQMLMKENYVLMEEMLLSHSQKRLRLLVVQGLLSIKEGFHNQETALKPLSFQSNATNQNLKEIKLVLCLTIFVNI